MQEHAIEMRREPAALGTLTPRPGRHMPTDHPISLRSKRAADRLITSPGGERRQPLAGYEETFTDILRCTHHKHYAANARVFQDDDRIAASYAPGLRFHGPTDREPFGRGDYRAYVLTRLAMFPDAAHRIDDVYRMGSDADGYTVAVRWTLDGTHRGHGAYGPPTGRRVRQWGLTHLAVRDRMIVEEWTYANEFHVLQQIHAPREDA